MLKDELNLPLNTLKVLERRYLLAYKLKCKGITVYRYGSKENQVLSFDYRNVAQAKKASDMVTVESEYSGGCAVGTCPF